jgi:hypothetical protein
MPYAAGGEIVVDFGKDIIELHSMALTCVCATDKLRLVASLRLRRLLLPDQFGNKFPVMLGTDLMTTGHRAAYTVAIY